MSASFPTAPAPFSTPSPAYPQPFNGYEQYQQRYAPSAGGYVDMQPMGKPTFDPRQMNGYQFAQAGQMMGGPAGWNGGGPHAMRQFPQAGMGQPMGQPMGPQGGMMPGQHMMSMTPNGQIMHNMMPSRPMTMPVMGAQMTAGQPQQQPQQQPGQQQPTMMAMSAGQPMPTLVSSAPSTGQTRKTPPSVMSQAPGSMPPPAAPLPSPGGPRSAGSRGKAAQPSPGHPLSNGMHASNGTMVAHPSPMQPQASPMMQPSPMGHHRQSPMAPPLQSPGHPVPTPTSAAIMNQQMHQQSPYSVTAPETVSTPPSADSPFTAATSHEMPAYQQSKEVFMNIHPDLKKYYSKTKHQLKVPYPKGDMAPTATEPPTFGFLQENKHFDQRFERRIVTKPALGSIQYQPAPMNSQFYVQPEQPVAPPPAPATKPPAKKPRTTKQKQAQAAADAAAAAAAASAANAQNMNGYACGMQVNGNGAQLTPNHNMTNKPMPYAMGGGPLSGTYPGPMDHHMGGYGMPTGPQPGMSMAQMQPMQQRVPTSQPHQQQRMMPGQMMMQQANGHVHDPNMKVEYIKSDYMMYSDNGNSMMSPSMMASMQVQSMSMHGQPQPNQGTCDACSQPLTPESKTIQCRNPSCCRSYHMMCSGLMTNGYNMLEIEATWTCQRCKPLQPH